MGEARRRNAQGLGPRQRRPEASESPRVVAWLPSTQDQTRQFVTLTTRGAWVGIGALVLFWVVVRFIGPAVGWWTLADG